ncbi:MAG: hypothetical protein ACOC8A_01330 [bacterium]
MTKRHAVDTKLRRVLLKTLAAAAVVAATIAVPWAASGAPRLEPAAFQLGGWAADDAMAFDPYTLTYSSSVESSSGREEPATTSDTEAEAAPRSGTRTFSSGGETGRDFGRPPIRTPYRPPVRTPFKPPLF